MPASSLTVSNFSCARGGRNLFAPVSFSLNSGEALILRGANGSGKSTLLRTLAGLFPSALTPYPSTLYLGHTNALHASMNADEHLNFWRSLHASTTLSNNAILETLGLTYQRDKRAAQLSNGQKRRLSFARLLLQQADCWLLDEPQAALDTASSQMLLSLISQHTARGGIAVIASHDDVSLANSQTLELQEAS